MNRESIAFTYLVFAIAAGVAPATVCAAGGPQPDYVGSQQCAECHEKEYRLWRASHHDLAMAEATEKTVLGDFDNATFTAHGVTSTFYRKDDGFFVRTDGPDGELHDYRIRYTFGWVPLQQYLIEFPGGRFQALGLAWDSRPKGQGGQRWFHLYPDEVMDHKNPLHWTARDQTWNYQCAECHSTELQKHYDLATDSYKTTWAEINVACGACHGPGSRHVKQALAVRDGDAQAWGEQKGLVVDLVDRDGGVWTIDPETGSPRRTAQRQTHTKIELCARCHSRRGQIHDRYEYGKPLGNTHRLSLLDDHLYYPDGQIEDEVYVYGSFIQSRMYRAGVTCSDCHDSHSLRLKLEGNLVCTQCHLAGRYDTEAHHHHPQDSTGASCTACHMPQKTYMVNDDRADHSMRIPRPDLGAKLGTPDACSRCHADKPIQWSIDAVQQWYGEAFSQRPHYGEALYAGRTHAPGAAKQLLGLAADQAQPGIARASALDLLREYATPPNLFTVQRLLGNDDPLIRIAAVHYLETVDPQTALRLGYPLLEDPVRAVRLEAARVLAPLLRYDVPQELRTSLVSAVEAYRDSQLVNAERPEAHLNIGLIELAQGNPAAAEQAYQTALRLDPAFTPGYANLADLYRVQGNEEDAERVLREGLQTQPESADLHHALGLLLVRKKRLDDAVAELQRASELAPGRARFAYVYAIALQSAGQVSRALTALEAARNRHPGDPEILLALVSINQEQGNRAAAEKYVALFQQQFPDDPRSGQIQRQLHGTQLP